MAFMSSAEVTAAQSNSLASSNSLALKHRDEQVLEKNHSPP
jgi:hypothetical protein